MKKNFKTIEINQILLTFALSSSPIRMANKMGTC